MTRKIPESEFDKIKSMFDDRKSISEIAKVFNAKRSSIYIVLKKFGIMFGADVPKHAGEIGKKYGFLIIRHFVHGGSKYKWQWRAVCECTNCGNKSFETSIQNIIRGMTTSCGCRRDQYEKNSGKNNKQYTGYENISGKVWSKIKSSAKNRRLSFEISIEFAWDLYEKQKRKCALSGIDIKFGKSASSLYETTASLDRIDSSKGYVEDNVQWVHKDVNIMKNVFSVSYFCNVCKMISDNCHGFDLIDERELVGIRDKFIGRNFRETVTP
jgi:predicted  nucleic acid-binding Zn-ribbon protein